MSRESAGLKQIFNFKCVIDVVTYLLSCVLLLVFTKIKGVPPYDTFIFFIIISSVNAIVFILTRHWFISVIKSNSEYSSEAIAQSAQEIENIVKNQTKIYDELSNNYKYVSDLMIKLQNLSESLSSMSKNAEKQINQSINFSQKEHDSISSSTDKMLVLRQKIQMIAELILELSEHTQQIGNSISVVDDIAEQTNMLALNAAVEAARAGEHGKGFAVVAGEIRKLADESKQAITKITSLTSSIQYTTNSTVMATEEGSKEIEAVVKDINSLFSDSEALLNLIKDSMESISLIGDDVKKYKEFINKLKEFDEQNTKISSELEKNISKASANVSELTAISEKIKNSVKEA